MTADEEQAMETLAGKLVDLRHRLRKSSARTLAAEEECARLRSEIGSYKGRLTCARKARESAIDNARFLHGVLLREDIDPDKWRLP